MLPLLLFRDVIEKATMLLDKNIVILTKVSGHHLVFGKIKFDISDMKFLGLKVSVVSPPVQVKLD